MPNNELKLLEVEVNSTNPNEEEFSVPLCIEDIISVCQAYHQLGHSIQWQIESILELGVEEAIHAGSVKQEALPHIKSFLQQIVDQYYFGEASVLANDCIQLICQYQEQHKPVSLLN